MKDESLPLIPPRDHGQSHDEIAAEIADHLAAAEADLTKRGIAAGEAREAARKKFGDVEKIQKTCYWIQNGETIMLRWTLVALASVLCILLGLSVLGNWRTQSQLADEMGKLSAELKSLAAAKQTPPPALQSPEITGVIYAGSKDKPLAGVDVAIVRTDATVIRRATCDVHGKYKSGALEPGDYCVVTQIHDAPQVFSRWLVQSQPMLVHSGSGTIEANLDVAYRAGSLKIAASRPLPEIRRSGKYLLTSRLRIWITPTRRRHHLWIAKEAIPSSWPVYCQGWKRSGFAGEEGLSWNDENHSQSYNTSSTLQLKDTTVREVRDWFGQSVELYPAGDTPISAGLQFDVFPLDADDKIIISAARKDQLPLPLTSLRDGNQYHVEAAILEEPRTWSTLMTGGAWLDKLSGFQPQSNLRNPPVRDQMAKHDIEIKDREFTLVRAEIPEGVEQEVEKAIESALTPEQFAEFVNKGLLTRPVKLTVVGQEAMNK